VHAARAFTNTIGNFAAMISGPRDQLARALHDHQRIDAGARAHFIEALEQGLALLFFGDARGGGGRRLAARDQRREPPLKTVRENVLACRYEGWPLRLDPAERLEREPGRCQRKNLHDQCGPQRAAHAEPQAEHGRDRQSERGRHQPRRRQLPRPDQMQQHRAVHRRVRHCMPLRPLNLHGRVPCPSARHPS
jgi:hypothetical protein